MDRTTRRDIIERLRADGARIATRFDLQFTSVAAENGRVKRRYGSCAKDGRIWIRLVNARTGEPLKYSSLIDTLCHELAHLRYFHHGPAFRAFYFLLLDWARGAGIYQPAARRRRNIDPVGELAASAPKPRRRAVPRNDDQLSLF